jgi:hypothetical protein
MRRVLLGLAAGLLLGGAGCRHCCGDRPRLFDASRRDPGDCRDDCPPAGRGASMPRLGAPLQGRGASLSGVSALPILPTYTAPVGPTLLGPLPADQLPMPGGTIPPPDVPLAPTSPAAPDASRLPPPSATRPAHR